MMIRRRHIDMRWLKAFTVLGKGSRKRTCTVQDLGHPASSRGQSVLDHEERRREILWQLCHEARKRLNASHRRPNNNNVMACHSTILRFEAYEGRLPVPVLLCSSWRRLAWHVISSSLSLPSSQNKSSVSK